MRSLIALGFAVVVLLVAGVAGCMAYGPEYQVYTAKMSGQAALAEANGSRFAAVAQSKAKMEAASYEAQSEIIRAKGVAAANKIVADGLGGPEGYLRYLYIQNLEQSNNRIIYVPTEAGLPILEAGHRPTQ